MINGTSLHSQWFPSVTHFLLFLFVFGLVFSFAVKQGLMPKPVPKEWARIKSTFCLLIRVKNIKTIFCSHCNWHLILCCFASCLSNHQWLWLVMHFDHAAVSPTAILGRGSEWWWTLFPTNHPLNPKQLGTSVMGCLTDLLPSIEGQVASQTRWWVIHPSFPLPLKRKVFKRLWCIYPHSPNNSCLWLCNSA